MALGPRGWGKSSPTRAALTSDPAGRKENGIRRGRKFEAGSTHTGEELTWVTSSAVRALRRWLLWAFQAGPSPPPPDPSPRPRPLSAPRLPSQIPHPWWTACPPSSTGGDWARPRQRLLIEPRRRHLPSPRPALRLRLGLGLWFPGGFLGSLVSQQLPRRTSRRGRERGRRDCAPGTPAWASAPSLSTHVPGAQGVDTAEAARKKKKKKFKDAKSPLLLFSWTGKASEIGKFEFSF